MSSNVEVRRYRINPVEIIILATIGAVFVNSIYNLFYDANGFHPAALKEMAANPISEGRSPASISTSFQNAEIACSDNPERSVSAAKIRLSGPLCRHNENGENAASGDSLIRASVLNETNKFSATVFTDTAAGKFSTDYIPLNAGKNQLKVEFAYKSGKIVTQDLAFTKY